MSKELITRRLNFEGCIDIQDFYERIIDSLDLEVGVCGLSWKAIYDSVRKESIVEKVWVKNTDSLPDELKSELPGLYETFDKIKIYRKNRGEIFVYEVLEGEAAMYEEPYTRTLDFKGCDCALNFFERIIEALELGVGRCGLNWDAIYDFGCTESTVEKLIIKNTEDLTDELKTALPTLYMILDRLVKNNEKYGDTFVCEIIEEKNTD